MKRRDFLKVALGAILFPSLNLPSRGVICTNNDKKLFDNKIFFAHQHNLKSLPIGQIIIEIAKTFLGSPYIAGTLDRFTREELIVNLREVDCFTFLEYVLSLAICIKSGHNDFVSFCNNLQLMRYRKGIINGYASRLHYFTDWMDDAEKKNLLQIIQGPELIKKPINILSSSLAKSNSKVAQNEQNQLNNNEKLLSNSSFSYFSCKSIQSNLNQFQNGDIVGFVSNVEGLDINHVGFLLQRESQWTFIHASSVNKQVEIYKNDLIEYCQRVKKNSGIIIGRAH